MTDEAKSKDEADATSALVQSIEGLRRDMEQLKQERSQFGARVRESAERENLAAQIDPTARQRLPHSTEPGEGKSDKKKRKADDTSLLRSSWATGELWVGTVLPLVLGLVVVVYVIERAEKLQVLGIDVAGIVVTVVGGIMAWAFKNLGVNFQNSRTTVKAEGLKAGKDR